MAAFLPSLPAMTAYFGTTNSVMLLSVSLYLATTAVLQLIIGPISDRYGRRSVTLVCLSIFILATVGCIFSPNAFIFLVFRMIQGAVAVGLVLSRAIVRDMVPQAEAASMIGYVTMGMALVPMVAPMIGGALGATFGWQSVFVFLAAGGVAVLLLCFFDLGETAAGGGLSFREQVTNYPDLLKSQRFWGYVLSTAFASGAFFAFLGGAPFVADSIFGLNEFEAGIGFGAPAIGYAVGNFLSGRYSVRAGVNRMVLIGTWVSFIGLFIATLLAFFGLSSAVVFFGFCTAVGLGNGMVIPNGSAGMLSVRPHLAGTASGLGSFFMIGGGAILSVLAGMAVKHGAGDVRLLALMTASMLGALISIGLVIRREKRIEGLA